MRPYTRRKLDELRANGYTPVTREEVRSLRVRLNLSQDNAAKLAGVSSGVVAAADAGRSVSNEMLAHIYRSLQNAVYDPRINAYRKLVNGHYIAVRPRMPAGAGWRRNGGAYHVGS
jgi:predicted transcriptional regulator